MEPRSTNSAAVVEVDAPLADAIVTMLRRQGCTAWTATGADGCQVLVPREQRDDAMRVLAAGMDELAASHGDRRPPPAVGGADADDEPRRRMVLPRLRDAGIAILLVPLLVVVLSAVNIPARYAAIVVLAGIALILVVRIRTQRDE